MVKTHTQTNSKMLNVYQSVVAQINSVNKLEENEEFHSTLFSSGMKLAYNNALYDICCFGNLPLLTPAKLNKFGCKL